jgi:hypothetical protein
VKAKDVFDENYVYIYEDIDGSSVRLLYPKTDVMVGAHPATSILNGGPNGSTLRHNGFILVNANISGQDDLYYIKTANVEQEYKFSDGVTGKLYRHGDDQDRPSDKYIALISNGKRYVFVDTQSDADLFKLKTRSSEMSLPTPFDDLTDDTVVDPGVTTKNYLVRVELEQETTS